MPELQGAVSDRIKVVRKFALLFLIFYSSCTPSAVQEDKTLSSPTPKRELKLNVPKATWEQIFFQSINELVERDGLPKLRETVLPEKDLEVRIWVGFGLYGIDGFIMKRSSGNWSAVGLKRMLCHLEDKAKANLQIPRSGWETTWQKLVVAGILTLPDSSALKDERLINDGKSYVVETNLDNYYRTYEYSNPDDQKWKEAEQIIKIGEIIADEFDLKSFSAKTNDCGKNE